MSQPRGTNGFSMQVVRVPSDVDTSERTLLWIGVRNQNDHARLVCIAMWKYRVVEGQPRASSAAETWDHACGSLAVFRIVAARETAYWPLLLPVAAPPTAAKVRLEVTIAEVGVQAGEEPREHEIAWEGRVSDAIAAATKLLVK